MPSGTIDAHNNLLGTKNTADGVLPPIVLGQEEAPGHLTALFFGGKDNDSVGVLGLNTTSAKDTSAMAWHTEPFSGKTNSFCDTLDKK